MSQRLVRYRRATVAVLALLAACRDATPPTAQPVPTPSAGQLPGQPTAKALTAVPDTTFRLRSQDYTTGHPDLPGMRISFNTALVGISPDATVGGMNALLQRLGATIVGGIAGNDGGPGALMVLRLPTTTHLAMTEALTALRAAPEVLVALADMVNSAQSITPTGSETVNWNWTSRDYAGHPNLGTWALAAIRAPQMWNLNPHLRAEGRTVATGVLDLGFDLTNEDLRNVSTPVGRQRAENHGTQVASIIGAEQGNGVGIDGTNPFARLFLGVVAPEGEPIFTDAAIIFSLNALLRARPEIRVVNVSLGYTWTQLSRPSINPTSRAQATNAGAIVDQVLQQLAFTQPLPVIVTSAGNDAGELAEYNSGLNNAGLGVSNHEAIIVVEADGAVDSGTSVTYTRADFSNTAGHISAPGLRVAAATIGAYAFIDGTSFSAPYVTGVVGYLLAVKPSIPAPTKSQNVIREILRQTASFGVRVGGQRQVDGFAAALELDRIFGTTEVLDQLLDIDDGTADGNTRVDPFSGTPLLTSDVRADATIDMSDFRRWRDLMSAIVFDGSASFDGEEQHPKRDVNGDGIFGTVLQENMFPFADFNGDGQLSLTAVEPMAGVLRPRGPLTDLQVLQSRFSDPTYTAADLDLLTASGDVHLRTTGCVPSASERVRVRLTRVSGGYEKEFIFAQGDSQTVLTVPAVPAPGALTPYTVRTSRLDAAGTELVGRETTVQVTMAGDVTSAAGCAQAVVATVTVTPASLTMTPGTSRAFTAVAREANGTVITGRIVQWTSSNDAVALPSNSAPTSGTTSVSANAAGTATIRARVSGISGSATVTVTTVTPPRISIVPVLRITNPTFGTVAPFTMTAQGGTAPYTWSLAPGSAFASAIVLSSSGVLTGACLSCVTGVNFLLLTGGQRFVDEPVAVTMIVRDSNGLTGSAEIILRYIQGF